MSINTRLFSNQHVAAMLEGYLRLLCASYCYDGKVSLETSSKACSLAGFACTCQTSGTRPCADSGCRLWVCCDLWRSNNPISNSVRSLLLILTDSLAACNHAQNSEILMQFLRLALFLASEITVSSSGHGFCDDRIL